MLRCAEISMHLQFCLKKEILYPWYLQRRAVVFNSMLSSTESVFPSMNFEMWAYKLACICHFKCLTSSITIKQYRSVYRRDEARSEDNVLLEDFYWFEFTSLCYDFTRCKKIIERLVWWWLQQYSDAETASLWFLECHSEVYTKGNNRI